jgi:hypothetical protein
MKSDHENKDLEEGEIPGISAPPMGPGREVPRFDWIDENGAPRLFREIIEEQRGKSELQTALVEAYRDSLEEDEPTGKFRHKLRDVLEDVFEYVAEKNRKYGDSALHPIRVFSKADPMEQLRVRLDDKLSRIRTCEPDDMEDSVKDLIGYLVLYRIGEKEAK